ncbi:MAG: hypothetical protein ACHQ2F_05545 [Desulfobaccales bacterium]
MRAKIRKEVFVNWKASLFWLILGLMIGGLISWEIADISNRETTRLLNLTLRSLESSGLGIKYTYDNKGKPVNLIITGSMNAVLPPITGSFRGTVGPPPDLNGKSEKPKK